MTAQQVADALGVAERTVRRWIARGELNATKSGRSFSIRAEDVEAMLGSASSSRLSAHAEERARDAAFAELQGRYNELKELLVSVQRELAEERRHSARLELQLEMKAA
jgi:excisionase family DNA binding protein